MGDALTPLDMISGGLGAPIHAGIAASDASKGPAPRVPVTAANWQPPEGQSIFDAYKQLLPQSFGQAAPVTNPDAIIKAYQANLPQLLQAGFSTRPTDINTTLGTLKSS